MRSRRTSPVAAVVAALAVLVGIFVVVPAIIPGLDDLNPFKETTEDRSPPVVVRSLESLSEYRAATSNMQVVVDVEKDTRFLPDFIKGERTLIVASGSVDASVDFRKLGDGDLRVNDDRTAVTVTLPRAKLSPARVDLARTRVFDRDRGLLDRVGDAVGTGGADQERQLLQLAQRRLTESAVADGRLTRAAERNTRKMLTGMLRGLGFERITIRFAPRPPAQD
jgi:hypothetical protein